jgi:predicted O-linked N-acetylglucosamine transferase (SPINDLY family)
MDDAAVARAIVADRIDILVVLAGHLDENRPFVARFRPAPVQVSQHDICTSAMPEMDYFIGDRFVTPRGGAERFSERVIRLPNFTVHTIPGEAGALGPLPAAAAGYVTFGSFNAPQKITDRCIDVWSALLDAVPGSRLVLKHFEAYSETATRARILGRFADRGVMSDRVSAIEAVDRRSAHLRAYDGIDIALDPFPFNGATTTFEALLMGVPVISMAGERFVSRCAAATLDAVGLGVCIAGDADDYRARAVELASDLERLAAIRASLRRAVSGSRICDADRYARNLGRAYRAIWRMWCRNSN